MLDLGGLPDLPQCRFLREVAADLWADADVTALWLGGSMARGEGDEESDVDLRVALRPEAFDPTRVPASAVRLTERAVIHLPFPWGEGAVLHHLMLDDGTIYDLLVQSSTREPHDEARLVLGCWDAEFGAKVAGGEDPAPTAFPAADSDAVRELILGLWMGQRKHLKVLRRGLPIAAWEGEHRMRQDLLRLWFIQATGTDCGDVRRLTIHTISPVVRAIQNGHGDGALALIGGPLANEADIRAGARDTQDEIARAGRRVAMQLGFDYPEAAESSVRRLWESETAPPGSAPAAP